MTFEIKFTRPCLIEFPRIIDNLGSLTVMEAGSAYIPFPIFNALQWITKVPRFSKALITDVIQPTNSLGRYRFANLASRRCFFATMEMAWCRRNLLPRGVL